MDLKELLKAVNSRTAFSALLVYLLLFELKPMLANMDTRLALLLDTMRRVEFICTDRRFPPKPEMGELADGHTTSSR